MSGDYEAVILAAGRGSRLVDQTAETPKALLPIGPRSLSDATETSFLRRQVELLEENGIQHVVVVVGYAGQRIAEEVGRWAPWVKVVENPTSDIQSSGSLHSFQYAVRAGLGVLTGERQTLLMDADIAYHRAVLEQLLRTPAASTILVCNRFEQSQEEVLVYGDGADRPRFLGKGLHGDLVGGLGCLGEATGIVKFAPTDHPLALATMNWLLGDPDAPQDSYRYRGFGPARRATEHEELTQRLMLLDRMQASVFGGDSLPFMEVDTPEEYAELRQVLYPGLLAMEAS